MTHINYLTIKQPGHSELDVKKSRFIGYVQRIHSEDDAVEFINHIKAENPKATNAYGYVLGLDDHIQRKNDDGEPSNTAGLPALDDLKLKHLHNTAIVVTRYFGGIELGAGGLTRAYSKTATNTINKAGIVKRILQTQVDLQINYSQFNSLKYFLDQHHYNIVNIKYTSFVQVIVAVDTPKIKAFQKQMINLLSDRLHIKIGKRKYFEIDYHQH